MTTKTIDEAVAAVEATLRQRNAGYVTESEADYLCGAMVALNAAYGTDPTRFPEGIPPIWMIYPMSGRPLFEDCPPPALTNRERELVEHIRTLIGALRFRLGPHTGSDEIANALECIGRLSGKPVEEDDD